MRVLILGSDGYIGWPLLLYLKSKGHEVCGIDNLMRRENVKAVGSNSVIPISTTWERNSAFREYFGEEYWYSYADIRKPGDAEVLLENVRPDAIVHLAEQPSAPYSMKSKNHCIATMQNNVLGTLNVLYAMKEYCPDAHLVKLGTMGEYGTPDCDIPEGFIPEACLGEHTMKLCVAGNYDAHLDAIANCPMAGLPFPKQPGSFYHATKVHDSVNIQLACKIWGLRSTDIMQGVVYGTTTTSSGLEDIRLATRFDYDQYFGTVINRFCAQAVLEHPLTVYGMGKQWRSFLPLGDSVECIRLLIENPPKPGEYRVVNQFDEITCIDDLARTVQGVAEALNLYPLIQKMPNPRVEEEDHHYKVERTVLDSLGYKPSHEMSAVVEQMLMDLIPFKERINPGVIKPTTDWRRI